MRTTPKNPGKGSDQDQKMSTRGRAPRPAGSPARKTSPPEFQSDRPRTGPTRPDQAKPAYKGRSSESARSSGPSRAGGKPFEKGERVVKSAARPVGAKPGFAPRVQGQAAAPALKETDFLSGRNPVMEALRSGRPISKVFIAAGAGLRRHRADVAGNFIDCRRRVADDFHLLLRSGRHMGN